MAKGSNKKSGAERAGRKTGREAASNAGKVVSNADTVSNADKPARKTAKGSGDKRERDLKNVTVTMAPEVARWARVRASGEGDSLARFLGDILREKMDREDAYDTAMMRYLGRGPQELRRDGGAIPRREELR